MSSLFEDFHLHPTLLEGLESLGFKRPTPVQAETIPHVLDGSDVIVQAKTGSGKTLAFGLPILSLLDRESAPQALVVVPTRELAIQISEALKEVSSDSLLRIQPIYGGVAIGPQEQALRKGIDVVIGTPGRLQDLHGRKSLDLSRVRILVLDEADEMLDMGFRNDIEYLLERLPRREQTLLLSATMPAPIEAIARKHMNKPVMVRLTETESMPTEISHYSVRCQPDQRVDTLVALLRWERPARALVFTRTKHESERLALKLERQAELQAGFLNGNMTQAARNEMLAKFRAGGLDLLVATDVAARGLDIDGLTHVFHFAVPPVVDTYIHRSGRTGRAGNEGKTIILVTPDAEADFKAISKTVPFATHPLKVDEIVPSQPAAAPRARRSPAGLRDEARAAAAPVAPRRAERRSERAPVEREPRQTSRAAQPPQPRENVQYAPQEPRHEPPREVRMADGPPPMRPDGKDAQRRNRMGKSLPPAHGQDPATLLKHSPVEEKPSTGPLTPLPRLRMSWESFKLQLAPGHRQSRDSLHTWLSQQTGIPRSCLRSIVLYPDHATVEVEGREVERFKTSLNAQLLSS